MGLLPFIAFFKRYNHSQDYRGKCLEVNSFSGSLNNTKDIPSPENPVSVPELSFTIQSNSNLSHDNISTSISNDSDTSFRKPSAIKINKNKF